MTGEPIAYHTVNPHSDTKGRGGVWQHIRPTMSVSWYQMNGTLADFEEAVIDDHATRSSTPRRRFPTHPQADAFRLT